MSDEKPPRKIKYSLGEGNDARKAVRYHQGSITSPGARGPWRDDEDNPMSAAFVTLTARSERAKSRWWALQARRSSRPTHGVYDA